MLKNNDMTGPIAETGRTRLEVEHWRYSRQRYQPSLSNQIQLSAAAIAARVITVEQDDRLISTDGYEQTVDVEPLKTHQLRLKSATSNRC